MNKLLINPKESSKRNKFANYYKQLPYNIQKEILAFLLPDSRLFKWRSSGPSRLFKVFLLNGKKISNHDNKYLSFKFKKNGKHQYFMTEKILLDLCSDCGRTDCSKRHRPSCDDFEVDKLNYKCPDCSIYICEGEKYEVIKYKSIYIGKDINYALLKLFMYEIQKISNTCMICNSHFSNKPYYIDNPPKIIKKNLNYVLTEHSFVPATNHALKIANARKLTNNIANFNSIKSQMKYNELLVIFMGVPHIGTSNFHILCMIHEETLEKYIAPVIHNEDEFNHYVSYKKADPPWYCQYYLIDCENQRCYER